MVEQRKSQPVDWQAVQAAVDLVVSVWYQPAVQTVMSIGLMRETDGQVLATPSLGGGRSCGACAMKVIR